MRSRSHLADHARPRLPLFLVASLAGAAAQDASPAGLAGDLFLIGRPDGSAREFGGAREEPETIREKFPDPVVFAAGMDSDRNWPFIHPGTMDGWAGSRTHPYSIRFESPGPPAVPLFLVIGL